MGDTPRRAAAPNLLHYRPWKGVLRPPAFAVWPIARTGLMMMLRRRFFWVLYGFSLLIFLLYFFGQYLLAWFQTQAGESRVRVGLVTLRPGDLIDILADRLQLNGSADTYHSYFHYQGYMVMIVLALAGAVLVGNDFRYGSLAFYLSKPLGRRHYLAGKGLAVAAFINLLTTLPALVLFVEYGLVYSWDYFSSRAYLALGIMTYAAVLTVSLTLMLLATAAWLRKTVPLIMAWTAVFLLCRQLATALVEGLHVDPRWRLIDLWNNLGLVGAWCLRMGPEEFDPATQPPLWAAGLVLGGVCAACLTYLCLRLRAVEIVR
jgi:ABC-type transport system involved in multi-copper enzyme maturation permease subunit